MKPTKNDEKMLEEGLFLAITAPTDKRAKEAAELAADLASRFPVATVNRAKKRAVKRAEEARAGSPSKADVAEGFSRLTEIFIKRGVTEEEGDAIWQIVAMFCAYQLAERKGPFYELTQGAS